MILPNYFRCVASKKPHAYDRATTFPHGVEPSDTRDTADSLDD